MLLYYYTNPGFGDEKQGFIGRQSSEGEREQRLYKKVVEGGRSENSHDIKTLLTKNVTNLSTKTKQKFEPDRNQEHKE